ncbi:MAG: flavodoxin family protein [Acidobacteriota bacterium]|jgi:multimeric flavodoxin WrbA|nr:flavodoxin family protein [Acidobacteriota bacterium]
MKVVVIFGSPRKKNSYLVTRAFEEELLKLGPVEFEYIFLNKLSLQPCIGCHNCLFYGKEKCPLPDSIQETLQSMLQADGLVFVSPVYVSQVTSLLKNFIDRFSFLSHRPRLYGQHAMAISTTGAIGLKNVLGYIEKVVSEWGIRSFTKLGLVTPPDRSRDDIVGDKRIRQAAGRFYKRLNGGWSPSLKQVIQFNAQKTFFSTLQAKKISPRDHEYYSALESRDYHVDVKISPFNKFIGRLISHAVRMKSG